jgi:hypothetical protein
MTATQTSQTLKRRQRVVIGYAMGDQTDLGTIVRPDSHMAGWYIVRFDDGGKLCIHGSNLTARG